MLTKPKRNADFGAKPKGPCNFIKAILFLPTLLPTLDNYTQLGIYSRSHSNLPLGRLRLPEDIPGPL